MGNSSKKKATSLQAETYYKNLTDGDLINSDSSPREQIQMHLSIRNAELYNDYSIIISLSEENTGISLPRVIGQTPLCQADDNGNINFEMAYIIYYYFEKQQNLLFRIIKNNKFSEITTTLGNVMGSRGQTLIKNISETEKLVISASTLKNNNLNVELTFSTNYHANISMFFTIKKSKFEGTNNFVNPNNTSTNLGVSSNLTPSEFISIYKSEVKNPQSSIFQFNKIKIPSSVLSNGDFDRNIIIEFHDFTNQILLASYTTTINKLLANTSVILKTKDNKELKINCLCELVKENTFIDYLRGGLQLALSIGIDFTGSNGHPADNFSLHHIAPGVINSYEKAIRSCGDIVAYYDYDQSFPVYGYGAIVPGAREVSHCFPLSLTNDPNIQTIDSVLLTYRNVVTKLTFSGPTLFSPLLTQILNVIKYENNKNIYHILLILTDGMINDMDNTIDVLVEASFLPLSIIIVGIGNNDFGNMNVLDADETPLVDRFGRKSARDLVQFVPFNQYQNDGKKLAEQVLEEVPRQVIDYFTRIVKIPPGDPIVNIG